MCLQAMLPFIKQISYINRTSLPLSFLIGVRHFSSRFKSKYAKRLAMEKLPNHKLPQDFIEYKTSESPSIELQKEIEKWRSNKSSMRENETNYIDSSRLMIHLEEAFEEVRVRKCNQNNVKLYAVDGIEDEFFFFVESTEMKDLYSTVKQFTEFTLVSNSGKRISDGQIISKENNKIFVELNKTDDWHPDHSYDIIFQYNRKPYLVQHQALDFIRRHKLFDLLINNPKYHSNTAESCTDDREYKLPAALENFNLNAEQNDAIVNMVRGDYFPLPYLLYGPAGTGKTKTLVATILTILETSDDNILVCTQSNDACDEITVRLKEYKHADIFRMYTPSRDIDEIPKSILTCANYFGGQVKLPPLSHICSHRVVICTLAMASCLTRANCSPDHFDYVIIDECASALEPMTLVPIAGLCTTENQLYAKIILAGDPKQLDALTISQTADELGHSTSFLEHLFDCPRYKRDDVSGKYDARYITQLVRNYRSHPAILHVPNQLFYDGTLKAEVAPLISDLDVHLPNLNPDFPVIFKSIQGQCIQPDDDTSWYNSDEISAVMEYIRTILHNNDQLSQSDVGVISPYRLQCEFIRILCKRNGFPDVTVGTAERFQGQERKIIIASTVCSRNDFLGTFVSDTQRLNVMLTRAQYLLIVVGDPHTLNTNPHWHEFIKYCYTNGSLIQSDNQFTLDSGSEMNVKK